MAKPTTDKGLILPEPAHSLLEKTRDILDRHLSPYAADLEGWKIGGGTILAARWRHRRSSDLDLLLHPDTDTEHFDEDGPGTLYQDLEDAGATTIHLDDFSLIQFPEGWIEIMKEHPPARKRTRADTGGPSTGNRIEQRADSEREGLQPGAQFAGTRPLGHCSQCRQRPGSHRNPVQWVENEPTRRTSAGLAHRTRKARQRRREGGHRQPRTIRNDQETPRRVRDTGSRTSHLSPGPHHCRARPDHRSHRIPPQPPNQALRNASRRRARIRGPRHQPLPPGMPQKPGSDTRCRNQGSDDASEQNARRPDP